jgi:acyl dehydratase
MPLNFEAVCDWRFDAPSQHYTDRDTMLYALSLGFGTDPLDPRELPFVYERDLRAVPTMAAVLCHLGPWASDPRTGMTREKIVHGAQRIEFHASLPGTGALRASASVIGIEDKGADKGAIVHVQRTLSDAQTGDALATIVHSSFCRADGGFGASYGVALAPHPIPARSPDVVLDLPTSPNAALLYRLNVDRNPLHVDPAVARRAGFERPVLHGLCTYGIAMRALLKGLLDYDAARVKLFEARFSSVVFPGETLGFEFWRDGGDVSFRAFSRDRDKCVLDNGHAVIA